MILLINNNSILYTESNKVQNNPMSIFEMFYTQQNIDISVDFVTWFNQLILPIDIRNYNQDELKQKIEKTIKSPMLLRQASFRLYPAQYDFTEENWPYIRFEVETALSNKKARSIKVADFGKFAEYLSTEVDKVIKI